LALWLERERLAHFLPVLTDEMLELQRGVVINERLQTTDNRPYGLADERLYQLLFSADHPYSWPTIGWMTDLERISLGDVRAFFETHYTPPNATLVIAGDVAHDEALELANRYFGDLRSDGTPVPLAPREGSADASRRPVRDTLPDRVSFPRIYRAHPTPSYGTADWVALDVLAYVLGDGESSRLQRALVREGELAQEIDTYLLPTELDGVFGIVSTARGGVDPEEVESRIQREIERVASDGVEEDELAGALRRIRSDQLSELGNLEDRADALAYAATLLGEADALNTVMEAYLRVTADEVMKVAEQYLTGGAGATVVVLPNGEAVDDE
jgi:zinc protease